MNENKYAMSGDRGKMFLMVNKFVFAWAERFSAVLRENMKEVRLRDLKWTMPENYAAKLILRDIKKPDPSILQQIAAGISDGKPLNFEFRGWYRTKDGYSYPIGFQKLVPVNGDLDDFINGYADEWEFDITLLDDAAISEFKKAAV
jgi:hypothetical protein